MKNNSLILRILILISSFISIYANNSEKFRNINTNDKKYAFCRKFVGPDLETCMKMQNVDGYIFNLLHLDAAPYQRLFFLKNSLKNSQDYKDLDEKYSEKKWQELWKDLSEKEKELFKNGELIACTKINLKKLIEKKENEEHWSKIYWWSAGACIVIATGGTIVYYHAPEATSAAITKAIAIAETIASTSIIKKVAMGTGAIAVYKLNQKYDLSGQYIERIKFIDGSTNNSKKMN